MSVKLKIHDVDIEKPITVEDVINRYGNDNFIITKDGKILGINTCENEIRNAEVEKVEIIEGVIKNLTGIRL